MPTVLIFGYLIVFLDKCPSDQVMSHFNSGFHAILSTEWHKKIIATLIDQCIHIYIVEIGDNESDVYMAVDFLWFL